MFESLQLLQPSTVSEAAAALGEFGDNAKVYAGGAELLLLIRHGLVRAESLIDVKKIDRLHGVTWANEVLRVGACVTHRALEQSRIVRERAPSFAYAESQVANIRVRNQGTLGGNLCFNDPHSDPPTVLLIHEASVTLGAQTGERQLSLDDFLLDMYTTALKPDELLLEVQFLPLPDGMQSSYLRLHRYQRPTLGVAAAAIMHNGAIAEARLAVGCIGPKAQRLPELERRIKGSTAGEAKRLFAEAKSYLRDVLHPVDDLSGSAEYKLYMAGVLLGDALEQAIENRGQKSEVRGQKRGNVRRKS
jgi:carbon-monoxide dehydrogenase medium subunit